MESAANVRSGTSARVRHVRGSEAQERFAARYGVSVATVRNYESGKRDPAADFLAALAGDGWNTNWLLTGAGPERLDVRASGRVAEAPAEYGAPSQDLSAADLSIALELTEEALRGRWLPKRDYAEVVAGIYAMLTQGLPYADILEFVRPKVTDKGSRQGASDGSRSTGDQPGDDADRSGEAGRTG